MNKNIKKKSKKKIKEFFHNCDKEKINILNLKPTSITKLYNNKELKNIINFYLHNTPVSKIENKALDKELLIKYGWQKEKPNTYNTIEKELLKSASIDSKSYNITKNISNQTLTNMSLDENICIHHPRAILKQYSNENRIECLFRHLRNAITHNRIFILNNNLILLEDLNKQNKISAKIIIPKQSLLKWIEIVDKNKILEKKN